MELRRIRIWLWLFIVGLVVSGVTALPLETEMNILVGMTSSISGSSSVVQSFREWIILVRDALVFSNTKYPFLAYGTDWLAFAHLVIAVAFIGPLRDPVKNIWVIEFGMIACLMVIPFAFIAGEFRHIPIGWRLIDCSFGVFGIIPLWLCRRDILKLQRRQQQA